MTKQYNKSKLCNLKIALISAIVAVFSIAGKADPMAIHGMALFGSTDNYLSHLPMFHVPHDYQLIMKVNLESSDNNKLVNEYKKSFAESHQLFTIVPKPMDLTKVIDGTIQTFHADLYQGHFEQDGKLMGSVKINIEKILLEKKLDPNAPASNEYFAFGNNTPPKFESEFYAVHIIGGKPSFDGIYKISGIKTLNDLMCKHPNCEWSSNIFKFKTAVFEFQSDLLPKIGDRLGVFGSSQIEKIIYFEQGELSH